MRRSTFSILLTVAILAIGGAALWLLLLAPRLGLPPYPSKEPPGSSQPAGEIPLSEKPRNSVLNLYLAPPSALPDDAARTEATLIKATLTNAAGESVTFFTGVQRVVLQSGAVEKVLSEPIPDGHWKSLTLEFSPGAELAYTNNAVKGALIEKKTATLSFNTEVAVSRTLAVFAILPFERETVAAPKSLVANISAEPQVAETYVLGGSMLDARGRGDIMMIKNPTLFSVIKEDIGFDLSITLPGSSGFQPATGAPEAVQPDAQIPQ